MRRWGPLLALTALTTFADEPTPIALPDVEGRPHTVFADGDRRLTVVLFITSVCPIANSYAREIQRLGERWAKEPVHLVVVHVDPELSDAEAARHAREYGYRLPVLMDRRHAMVARAGATKTPEAAVFDGERKLRYRGRIDNRWVDYGVQRERATQHDLRDAVEALLAGHAPAREQTEAIGCDMPAPA